MDELIELGVNLEHLEQCINDLKFNQSIELKKLYKVNHWKNDIMYPKKVGRIFKKLVINGEIKNLSHTSKQGDNHNTYTKIK